METTALSAALARVRTDPAVWGRICAAGFVVCAAHVVLPDTGLLAMSIFGFGRIAGIVLLRMGAKRVPHQYRSAWNWVGAWGYLQLIGDGLEALTRDGGRNTAAGWSDFAYLGSALALAVGFALMIRARNPIPDPAASLDAVMTGGGAAFVVFGLPLWVDMTDLGDAQLLYTIAYPLAGVVLIGLVIRLRISSRVPMGPTNLLIFGVLGPLFSDLHMSQNVRDGDWQIGSFADVGYLLAPILFAAAVWHPQARELMIPPPAGRAPFDRTRMACVGLAIAAVVGAYLVDAQRPVPLGFKWFATGFGLICAVAMLRTLLMVGQVRDAADCDPTLGIPTWQAIATKINNRLDKGQPVTLHVVNANALDDVTNVHGSGAANQLGHHIAQALQYAADPRDIVGRWNDTVFVVIQHPGANDSHDRAQRLSDELNVPVLLDEHPYLPNTTVRTVTATRAGTDLHSLILAEDHTSIGNTDHRDLMIRWHTQAQEYTTRYQSIVNLETRQVAAIIAAPSWNWEGRTIEGTELHDLAAENGFAEDLLAKATTDLTDTLVRAAEIAPEVPLFGQIDLRPSHLFHPHVVAALVRGSEQTNGRIAIAITEADMLNDRFLEASAARLERHRVAIVLRVGDGPLSLNLITSGNIIAVNVHDGGRGRVEPGSVMMHGLVHTIAATNAMAVALPLDTPQQVRVARSVGFKYGSGTHFGAAMEQPRLLGLIASQRPSNTSRRPGTNE